MKLLLVSLMSLLVILAGCASQEPAVAQQTSTQTPQPSQDEQQSTPAQGDQASLQDLLIKQKTLEHQVTYNVLTSTGGEEYKTTMILYSDGAGRLRTDISVPGQMETRIYNLKGAVNMCSKVNNRWTCQSSDEPDDVVQELNSDIIENPSDYDITADGTKSVLGKQAQCFKIFDPADSATMRQCFSSEGVPVYMLYEFPEGSTEMTALLYGTDVNENVWVIPT